jgi:HAD superfamily hydrolase (TIGR01450 family)
MNEVVILAAGVGSRLTRITKSKPKCLIKVAGNPIIKHQLDAYLLSGIAENNITVVTGYKHSQIKKYLKEFYPQVNILKNNDYSTTNNMYSLWLALNDNNNNLIISNGDCVYEPSIVRGFISDPRENIIACEIGEYEAESMKIRVDEIGNIREIAKTIDINTAYAVSIDLYKLSTYSKKKLLEIIEEYIRTDKNSWSEVAINILLKNNEFHPFDIKNLRWVEIDNMEDLIEADIKFSKLNMRKKKALVLDLDGTVYLGETPILNTINYINQNDYSYSFMTNNTSKSKLKYVEKLFDVGLNNVNKISIITPVDSIVKYLKSKNVNKIFCFGTKEFINEMESHGIKCYTILENHSNITVILLGYDTELSYMKLVSMCNILNNKPDILYLASHADVVCPTEKGPIPDIGAMIQMLYITTNRKPDVVFGKPQSSMLEAIYRRFSKEEILIIGDRIYTDMQLAENVGVDFCLVLSGETKRDDIESHDKAPAIIVNDLKDLSGMR